MIGANAYVRISGDEAAVELALFPADTLSQARAFYQRPAAVSGLLRTRGLVLGIVK